MGNTLVSPCFPGPTTIKLIFPGESTHLLTSRHVAGQLMVQFPDTQICHANSFFIGQPVPALTAHDELIPGETYFAIPSVHLPRGTLTASSLAQISKSHKIPVKCAFELVKRGDGKAHVRVLPEFIEGIMKSSPETEKSVGNFGFCEEICSTPELRKQYEQLVGPKTRPWSPGLETIRESGFSVRMSPGRFFRCDKV